MKACDPQTTSRRLTVVRQLFLATLVILALRVIHLTVISDRGAAKGSAQVLTSFTLAPERGTIIDRTGAELAVSVKSPSVYAVASEIEDPKATAKQLAKILGVPHAQIENRLAQHRGFAFLQRWITPEQAKKIVDLDLPGIGIVSEPHRVYPYRELAAPLIGFANIDGRGVRGIEESQENWLHGNERKIPVERDARGRLLALPGTNPRDAVGGDIMLTLHAAMQADAEAALDAALKKTGARSGIVIAMDPYTGDLLAVAERPVFDPNRFRETPFAQTRSRAFLDAYEPGSTMKAFLVAAALDRNAIRTDELFHCENGSYRVPGKTIRDHDPHGLLDARSILQVSSNIGSIKIAERLGAKNYYDTLQKFGFGRTTGSGFPHESAGMLRHWLKWRPVDHANAAFGQGMNVTPLQLAVAASTLANGGLHVEPRLIAATRRNVSDKSAQTSNEQAWQSQPISTQKRVIQESTAKSVVSMLESVVTSEGTARKAALRNVRVAGKTGTAQILNAAAGTYFQDHYSAWFFGIVPADAPKLVIVVQLTEPQGIQHTGGDVAAPLFAEVAAAHLAKFDILTRPEAKPKIWQNLAKQPITPAPASTFHATETDAAANRTQQSEHHNSVYTPIQEKS